MTADEKDFSNRVDPDLLQDEDIVDAEVIDETVDVRDYESADFGGDDDGGFMDDERGADDEGSNLKKFMLPGLILVAAVGAGTFMFLGAGGNNAPPPAPVTESAAPEGWEQQAEAVPAELDAGTTDGILPQPAVNLNQPDQAAVMPADGATDPAAIPPVDPTATPDAVAVPAEMPPVADAAVPADGTVAEPATPDATTATEASTETPAADTASAESPAPEAATAETAPVETAASETPPAEPALQVQPLTETQAQPDPNSPGYSTDTSKIFEMPSDAQPTVPPPAMPPPTAAVPIPAPAPTTAGLVPSPAAETFPSGATPSVPGVPATGAAAAPVDPSTAAMAGPDTYYDSTINVPNSALAGAIGPRKVDPVMEPASKFVVVEKTHSASDWEARLVAANRALKLGRYDAAAEMFESLYRTNPRDQRILMGQAVAYQRTGRPESAIRAYEELLAVDPKNADALVNMLGLLREQYPEVALRRLINLYDKYPDNAGIAAQIGVTQGGLGQTDDALRYLNIAASLEPRNAQHLFNTAVVLDRAGRRPDAIKYYQQALETDAVYGGSRSVPREQIYDRLSVLRQQR